MTQSFKFEIPKYTNYRSRFLDLANAQKLTIASLNIQEKGPLGEDLFIDFAFSPGSGPCGLVHISATHGIEGYLGSDIQSEILKSFEIPGQVPVLFVHALNPFGMAWYRRCNSANVDLNRNGVKNFETQLKTSLPSFKKLLSSSSQLEFFARLPLALIQAQAKGWYRVASEIAQGQYSNGMGLFYGGASQQTELRTLVHLIKNNFKMQNELAILDVHTGLGSFGEENIIIESEDNFFSLLPSTQLVIPSERSKIYPSQGSIAELLHREIPNKSIHYAAQEFGTSNSIQTLKALVLENTHFLQKAKFNQSRAKNSLKEFYPRDIRWRKKCAELGTKRFQQVWNYLKQKGLQGQSTPEMHSMD